MVKRAVSISDVCSRMYGKKGSLHAMCSGCCDVLPRGALWDWGTQCPSSGDCCCWLLTALSGVPLQEWSSAQGSCLTQGQYPAVAAEGSKVNFPWLNAGNWRTIPVPELPVGSVDASVVTAVPLNSSLNLILLPLLPDRCWSRGQVP